MLTNEQARQAFINLQIDFPSNETNPAYWNHVIGSPNNPNAYTSFPCTHHGSGTCNSGGTCGCNAFGGAYQCFGFAIYNVLQGTRHNPKHEQSRMPLRQRADGKILHNTLKAELINRYYFRTDHELNYAIAEFDYGWYNQLRPHAHYNYLTPYELRFKIDKIRHCCYKFA